MKKEQTQYDVEIGELRASIDKQREKLFGLVQKRAEETCKFKVGDRVVNKQGQVGEVVGIQDCWGEGIANIGLYKKDGTMGLRRTKAYSWKGWELQ